LQTRCGERSDLDLVDAGTLSFTLAASLEGHDGLIVIDAAELEASPGTIGVFEGIAMDRFLAGNRKLSVHEVSLLDLLAMARLANELPANRALIGIQPERVAWGEVPTATVAAAIPDVSRVALSLIERWNADAA
jgi:hydrogenase maturation protease